MRRDPSFNSQRSFCNIEKLEVYNTINQEGFLEYSDLIDYIAEHSENGDFFFNYATSKENVPWIVEYLNSRKRIAKERKERKVWCRIKSFIKSKL